MVLGGLAAAGGCSGNSIVIGGDPNGEGATSGAEASGGSDFVTGGNGGNGGTFITGGTGATGGAIGPRGGAPYGGTTGVNGGTSTIPGSGGVSGTGIAEGGEGGVVDAYPRVFWEGGQGYRTACPTWGDTRGFTCWNYSSGMTHACTLDGSSYCNACSCAVPCETSADCPAALTGQRAACLSSTTNVPSCFVLCEARTHCPTGMTCMSHPGSGEMVCAWWSDRVD